MHNHSTPTFPAWTLLALLTLSCNPFKQSPSSSSVQGDDACSGEPKSFPDLPLDCQQNILANLSDKELVRFAKAVSKQTSKVGFATLLNKAKKSVPESLQLEIDDYVSRFRHCMDTDQSTAPRSHPIFLEKLISYYLSHVKLMNTSYSRYYDWRNPVQFKIGRIWVPTKENPIIMGNRNIVSLKSEGQNRQISLEVRDSVTFKVKSTRILESVQVNSYVSDPYPVSLKELGPQSFFLVSKPEKRQTLWTFKTNVWKQHQTFSPDVKIFGVKDQDLFFAIEKDKLIRYSLKEDEFKATNLGTFPTLPHLQAIATNSDQLITLETVDNTSFLKIWSLSGQKVRLANTFKYEGQYRAPTLHEKNILSFIAIKEEQYSYILFDTVKSKQLLKINEPFQYGWNFRDNTLKFINEKTFVIMQRPQSQDKYEGYLVSVPTWDETKDLGSIGKSNHPFVAPYGDSYFVYYGDALYNGGRLLMRSVEVDNRYFDILPVDHKSPPGTLKQTEGGFLSINGDGFAIYSPWNKVMEKIETYL